MQEKRGIFERIFRLFRKYAKTAAVLFMKTSFDFAADPCYDKANGSREGFVMTKRMKIWTWTVFALYLAWLVWAILFKFHLPGAGPLRTMRSIEWIPFAPREIERRQTLEEMALNLIVFIPLGAYLTALLPKGKRRWVPLIGLGASLMFEVLQYVFAIGAADVTDLIMNTAGRSRACCSSASCICSSRSARSPRSTCSGRRARSSSAGCSSSSWRRTAGSERSWRRTNPAQLFFTGKREFC